MDASLGLERTGAGKDWENAVKKCYRMRSCSFCGEEDVDPKEAVKTYLAYTKMVVVTRGKRGASIYTHDGVYHSPAFPAISEVDPTGAGDVF